MKAAGSFLTQNTHIVVDMHDSPISHSPFFFSY